MLQPGIFFGKGFGDLPDALAWLRPFAITGAVTLEHPMKGGSINFGVDPQTGQLGPILTRNVDTLHWGFALEFSTLYLTSRFTPGKLPKEDPLNQLVPLVEFSRGAAEIQRIAENASRWPDINSLVQPSSTWPSSVLDTSRREFIALVGGAAAWLLAARAQGERVRR